MDERPTIDELRTELGTAKAELAVWKLAILSGIEQVEITGRAYTFVLNVEMS